MEGVMMKHKDRYAVAVRKPDGEIEIDREDYRSIVGNYHSLLKIPFVRGIFQFIDSMVLGMRTLTWSAGFEEEEDILTEQEAGKKERADRIMNGDCDGSVLCTCHCDFYGSSIRDFQFVS